MRIGVVGAAVAIVVIGVGCTPATESGLEGSITPPSQETSLLASPEELASMLPTEVGDLDLTVVSLPLDQTNETVETDSTFSSLLLSLGKTASDLRIASAAHEGGGMTIFAVSVGGVDADTLAEAIADAILQAGSWPWEVTPQWQEVEGRRVLVLVPDPDTTRQPSGAFYPKNGVVFMINQGVGFDVSPGLAGALEALP